MIRLVKCNDMVHQGEEAVRRHDVRARTICERPQQRLALARFIAVHEEVRAGLDGAGKRRHLRRSRIGGSKQRKIVLPLLRLASRAGVNRFS